MMRGLLLCCLTVVGLILAADGDEKDRGRETANDVTVAHMAAPRPMLARGSVAESGFAMGAPAPMMAKAQAFDGAAGGAAFDAAMAPPAGGGPADAPLLGQTVLIKEAHMSAETQVRVWYCSRRP
jgi:hypothetical protein